MAEINHLSGPEDSETDSEDEFSSLEDILKKGGRKETTIKKEECYLGKWKYFLKTEAKVN